MIFGASIELGPLGIPNVTGYRAHLYQIVNGKVIFPSVNGPIPAKWPVTPTGVVGFYTIYPNPQELLSGKLDGALHAFIDSAPSWGGVLTAYAEADANPGAGGQFASVGLSQATLHQVHAYLQRICHGTKVKYGSVMCGINAANTAFAIPGLDFYALDIYDSFTVKLFDSLDLWRRNVGNVQRSPVLAIAETNSSNSSRRPFWFSAIYGWLRGYEKENGGRALGYWSYWNPGGVLSGPWLPNDTATVNVMKNLALDAHSELYSFLSGSKTW